jgi:hypothetical protein
VGTGNEYSADLSFSTATGLNGSLIAKVGSGSYTPPSGYVLAASGTDYAIWKQTINPVAPLLMVTPSGGTYYTPQTVTATATSGASVYYTTNNTAPNNTSNLYTAPINVTTTETLRIIAYDPATQLYSNEVSNTYTIASAPTAIKVRFKAPVDWTTCKVYSWVGSTPLCGAWPGTSMTLENDGYYSYTITGFTTVPVGVVFNNGAASGIQQTVDLSASADKCWDAGPLSGGKYTAIEVTCPTVGIADAENFRWNIFPNPTPGLIRFNVPERLMNVTVASAAGRQLAVKPILTASVCQIDLSTYPAGVYYITLTMLNGTRESTAVVKY